MASSGGGLRRGSAEGGAPAESWKAHWREALRHGPAGRRLALAGILALAAGLRLWGAGQGLPFVYNSDEDAHFVPRAIGMFGHSLDPNYFANPPAYTYLLHFVFAIWWGGPGVSHAYATDPTQVYVLARVIVALLGVGAVWLLYLAGRRLFDARVAMLAAALEAVAFLPVFYSHVAVNDVPALAPLTLSLWGTAGVLRSGRRSHYVVAGIGLGLGCATKYTAGIVLVPLIAAAACHYLRVGEGRDEWAAPIGLALAGACAVAAFLIANPYSVVDFHAFRHDLAHQSSVSAEAAGKLGSSIHSGFVYYMWTLTWGLGWVPALAAVGGAARAWRVDRRRFAVLVPAVVLFLVFMGSQGRFFGRWLLPIFPIVCLLAADGALAGACWLLARAGMWRARGAGAGWGIAALALCAQGLVFSVHDGVVLARADTRNVLRSWMVAHVPAGSKIVIEPAVPDEWSADVGHPLLGTPAGYRWVKYPSLLSHLTSGGRPIAGGVRTVSIEDYERTLYPGLIDLYAQGGYCWVVTGSTQLGRAFAAPRAVPQAVAYYAALARRARVAYRISPLGPTAGRAPFDFDWSFDYYPLDYGRPGPALTVYRLTGGACA